MDHLWKNSVVQIPESLASVYHHKLDDLGFLDDAKNLELSHVDILAGSIDDVTNKQLTHRFAASAARMIYLLAAKDNKFSEASIGIISTFHSGRIAVLDIPCGAGPTLFAFLTALSDSRQKNVLPTLPLDVYVCGGDISALARQYYDEMLTSLAPTLAQDGINVHLILLQWDATRTNETANLIDKWYDHAKDADDFIVLFSAFSGVAGKNFENFRSSFDQIVARLHNRKSTVLWIEPRINDSEALFGKIRQFFSKLWTWFSPRQEIVDAEFQWHHPIKRIDIKRGTIRLLSYGRDK